MDEQCKACGMPTSGYKCALCDVEASEQDPMHSCGPEELQLKCTGCNLAESKCAC